MGRHAEKSIENAFQIKLNFSPSTNKGEHLVATKEVKTHKEVVDIALEDVEAKIQEEKEVTTFKHSKSF